jgi:hypothetical protein
MRKTTLLAAGLLSIAAVSPILAKFARTWEPVPADRLLANVGRFVKEHPKDARGHYTLGRLHAMLFATGPKPSDKLEVVVKDWQSGKPLDVPDFARMDTVRVKPAAVEGKLSEAMRNHLAASLGEYRWAVLLSPTEPLYALGYAWMLDIGAKYAAEVPVFTGEAKLAATTESFMKLALDYYRKAYSLSIRKELDNDSRDMNAGDTSIATEAGEGILSILEKRPGRSDAEKAEISKVKRDLAEIAKKPGFITPLVLSFRNMSSLNHLLSGRTARFDLAASGRAEVWPWVKPDTGILVWDPSRSGKIVSGRQIFGSRTWQMFWRNGFEPLAALDDDGSGFLDRKELAGIAIWFDRDGNGRSNRSEVVPVEKLGVCRIAVRPDGFKDGVPFASRGVTLTNGRPVPVWDWTPASIPDSARMPVHAARR